MVLLFLPVVILMFRGAIANWKLQEGYRKYQNLETGWRHFFWPNVWVGKTYFQDKPDLLRLKKNAEKRLLQFFVAAAIWMALGYFSNLFSK
jgi:hypothetical protein